jgi:hypothetical protein
MVMLVSAAMKPHRLLTLRRTVIIAALCLILAGGLGGLQVVPTGRAAAVPVPARLSDQEFWDLSQKSSEEDGFFRSDNLLSNETTFQYIIPDLLKSAKQGRVYLGVGPEQNFTYMVALKPAMAVIIDIRHGNLDVHLMYKALFELSKDRAEFVSRLFSRKRPAGLTAQSSARQIFNAFMTADGSQELYDENLKAIQDQLIKKHGFALTSSDRDGIQWALSNYHQFGPAISYNSSLSSSTAPAIVGATAGGGRFGGNNGVTYASLMMSDDGNGANRGFLASEENFAFLKDLETRNMVVPVVGDFGGPKAIRAVARYLKSIDAMVSAFYVSNVEQFLVQDGKWDTFCASSSALPLDDTSTFIRTGRGGPYAVAGGGGVQNSSTGNMLTEFKGCAASPR